MCPGGSEIFVVFQGRFRSFLYGLQGSRGLRARADSGSGSWRVLVQLHLHGDLGPTRRVPRFQKNPREKTGRMEEEGRRKGQADTIDVFKQSCQKATPLGPGRNLGLFRTVPIPFQVDESQVRYLPYLQMIFKSSSDVFSYFAFSLRITSSVPG